MALKRAILYLQIYIYKICVYKFSSINCSVSDTPGRVTSYQLPIYSDHLYHSNILKTVSIETFPHVKLEYFSNKSLFWNYNLLLSFSLWKCSWYLSLTLPLHISQNKIWTCPVFWVVVTNMSAPQVIHLSNDKVLAVPLSPASDMAE